jgi:hypothetical protein
MSNINELLNKATDLNFKDCPKGAQCPFRKHACLYRHEGNHLYLWNKDCKNGNDCLGNGKICELNHSIQESKTTFYVDRRQKTFIPPLPLPPRSYLRDSNYGINDYEPPLHYRSPAPAYIPLRRERSRSRERVDYDRRDYDRRDYDRPDDRRDDRLDYNRRDDRLDYNRRDDRLDYNRRDDRLDYNRRDDRLDYDRRDYDRREEKREEVIIPYVNDKESLCNNGAYCKYHKDKICRFMHPDQIEECLQINRTRGVYAAMTRAKQLKNEGKTNCFSKKY